VRRTRRARYLAGQIGDQQVPAYVDEEGVSPRRGTETFAEMELELDNWRWPGTVFRLRTGKALGRDRKEVAVHFRSVPHLPFGHGGEALPNVLRFGLDPESLTLDLTGIGARAHTLVPLELTARIDPSELPAYGRLLLDVLNGNAALSIRGDEAEQAWRVVAPVLSAWSKDLVPMLEYPAGSPGPGRRGRITAMTPGRLPEHEPRHQRVGSARPAAAMEQAEPTSPWQPTSAPEMGRVLLEQQPDGAGGQQEADHPLPGVRAGEVPVVVQDSRHGRAVPGRAGDPGILVPSPASGAGLGFTPHTPDGGPVA
jgi:hypothetical protein